MRVGEKAVLGPADASDVSVAVVYAVFNEAVTTGLLNGALAWLSEAGAVDPTVVAAPGAFELPIVARKLAATHDAVVALGAVVLGGTDHYEHVAHRASEGLMQVMLETDTPVAFGILTTRTAQDAIERSAPDEENKGAEAAEAAVRAVLVLREIDATTP